MNPETRLAGATLPHTVCRGTGIYSRPYLGEGLYTNSECSGCIKGRVFVVPDESGVRVMGIVKTSPAAALTTDELSQLRHRHGDGSNGR